MTATTTEHTPTPWYASDDGAGYSHIFTESGAVEDIFVAMIDASDAQTQANVTYIVKAANAYPVAEKLASQLQWFVDSMTDDSVDDMPEFLNEMHQRAHSVLEEWENQS